jgi:hypothetical protein
MDVGSENKVAGGLQSNWGTDFVLGILAKQQRNTIIVIAQSNFGGVLKHAIPQC